MVHIGVVGHGDVAEIIATAVDAGTGVTRTSRFPTVAALEAHLGEGEPAADAWLFTDIHTHHEAEAAGLLDRPAAYVIYTAGALQQVLITALRAGRDITRVSIDTMSDASVTRAYAGADMRDIDAVDVLPFRPGLTAADYAAFHRERVAAGAELAVTCAADVAEALAPDTPVVLMRPLREVIDSAVDALVVEVQERDAEGAQIAIGHVEADAPGLLASLSGDFDGWVSMNPATVLVSTRGGLESATRTFTTFPLVDDADLVPGRLRIGFGIAFSAAEASRLADRALKRAQLLGERSAVVMGRHGVHLVHVASEPGGAADKRGGDTDLESLALRAGLSVRNLRSIFDYGRSTNPMTARGLAGHLGIQDRSARRILNQLDNAGLAERSVEPVNGSGGRPAATYLVSIPSTVEAGGPR